MKKLGTYEFDLNEVTEYDELDQLDSKNDEVINMVEYSAAHVYDGSPADHAACIAALEEHENDEACLDALYIYENNFVDDVKCIEALDAYESEVECVEAVFAYEIKCTVDNIFDAMKNVVESMSTNFKF